jgi:proton-dependent oligopeptide transporter, POT family
MSDPTTATNVSPDYSRSFFGHPRGLATLFMTEFFERFTYYGVRTMLVLFLAASTTAANPGYGIDNETAGAVYALFAGCAYLVTVPGGWIADQLIGQRNAVFSGGVLIAIGNFVCAVPATPAILYIGLAFTVLGIGLLKPNVSSVVGALYEGQPGARRDAGFSIFYMGINLGAALGPIIAAGVGEDVNWRLGFGICGVAMLIGLVQFKLTEKYLGTSGLAPVVAPEQRRRTWILVAGVLVLALIGAAVLFLGKNVPSEDTLARGLFIFEVALAVAFFGYVLFFGGLTSLEKKRVGVIIIFFLCAALFWGGFEQQATTFNIFALDYTDRSLFGNLYNEGLHPAAYYQAINPIGIILFAPFFAWIWVSLGARNLDPSAPFKMGFGLIMLGLGFLVMVGAAKLVVSTGGKVGPVWLLMAYLIHTFGELCLSPVGLSNVTKLSPPRFVSRMMGTWFLGAAIGNTVAGLVGGHTASLTSSELPHQFWIMTLIGGGAGVFIMLLARPLRSWIGDRK